LATSRIGSTAPTLHAAANLLEEIRLLEKISCANPLRRRLLTNGAGFQQKDCRLSNIQFPKMTNRATINSGDQKELPNG
jgi:hypothetical protein